MSMPLIFKIATIASIFWIPAGFVAIRNYLRIGSLDYLIFAGWFFTNGLGFLSGPIYVWHMVEEIEMPRFLLFLMMLNQIIMLFFISAHPLRLRWQWKDRPIILWIIIASFLVIFLGFLIFHTLFPEIFQQEILDFFLWVCTFNYAVTWTFVYFTLKPISEDTRVKFVIYAWRFVGLVDLFNSIIIVGIYIFLFFSIPTLPIVTFQEFVLTYLMIPYVAVVFLVGVFVPEAMIISEAQILRAYKLYETVKQLNCEPEIVDQDKLLSYMCKIGEEFFPPQA
ncbi:MAG: hypothetical protein ACFFB2_09295 [Promethearchaeota archaeon]